LDLLGAALSFVLVSLVVYAIIGAKGNKAKLLNLFNILGFMVVGQAMGYVLGAWGGNTKVGMQTGIALMYLLGLAGSLGRIRANRFHRNE
jgi:hypothetical protein